MSLVKAACNMYPFVTHTWNPIKGRCKMGCPYCYVQHSRAKRYYQGEPYLAEKELRVNLGKNRYIFVGSMTDMWGDWIQELWIRRILVHCRAYPTNRYLFQSKNPGRFIGFWKQFPRVSVVGTTIESLRPLDYFKSAYCREQFERAIAMLSVKEYLPFPRMISIEPIMRFMLSEMISVIQRIEPAFVVIGADSKGHRLPEPTPEEVKTLIRMLKKVTRVVVKKNLKRLLNAASAVTSCKC